MKTDRTVLKNQPKQAKPFFRTTPGTEKKLHLTNQNPKRLRIVQSVNAGHVRGGHSFH